MATLESNVTVSRSYEKVDDTTFLLTTSRDITEKVSIIDTYTSLKQIIIEIRDVDKKIKRHNDERGIFVNGYNNLVKKATEQKDDLIKDMVFPVEFTEEMLNGTAEKTLPNIFAGLDNVLSNIKSIDEEIKKLEEARAKKISLYNDIAQVITDVKAKFRNEIDDADQFSEEMLEKPSDNVSADAV